MTTKVRYPGGLFLVAALLALGVSGGCVADSPGGEAQAAPMATETLPSATRVDYLLLPEDESDAAAELLASYLEEHGIEVLLRKEGNVAIRRGSSMYIVSPKVSIDGIDRIVVTQSFSVEDRYRHSSEVSSLVRKLNEDFNIGSFFLDSDGDLLFQSHVTFLDRLDFAELDGFLEFVDRSTMMALLRHPRALLLLE